MIEAGRTGNTLIQWSSVKLTKPLDEVTPVRSPEVLGKKLNCLKSGWETEASGFFTFDPKDPTATDILFF